MTALTDVAIAVLLGGGISGGMLLVLASLPRWRTASLSVRIAPYVRSVVLDELLPAGVLPVVGTLPARARSGWRRMPELLGRILGGDGTIALRLSQAGQEADVTAFRGRQLLAALLGLLAGAALVVLLALGSRLSAPVVILPFLGAVGGALAVDAHLTARARARVQRLHDELPTTLEFLALCLSAGRASSTACDAWPPSAPASSPVRSSASCSRSTPASRWRRR
ncbi:hypothetical protein [Microbacterium sp. NIBRBAC000506063]|uniref:hypothetical protein n=1 Tax=Microbacterium sp. NIBRBAC000506063 TaxID=2734618 RepID=UPI001CB73429|nr:hypothetical protein [Microbacterium sp. NIBRBAC000506063]